MVENLLIVQWVIRLIPHSGLIQVFLIPAIPTNTVVCPILFMEWYI